MKQLLTLSTFLLILITGCSPVAEFPVSDHLSLVVKKMDVDEDSYRVVVAFKEKTRFETVIQEVFATNSKGNEYLFIESFDTLRVDQMEHPSSRHLNFEITEFDHHAGRNVEGWEKREYTFYAGKVRGADKTSNGFAILRENFDGSIQTKLPPNVNAHYQKRFKVAGTVSQRHPENGKYTILWTPNRIVLTTASGSVSKVSEQEPIISYHNSQRTESPPHLVDWGDRTKQEDLLSEEPLQGSRQREENPLSL